MAFIKIRWIPAQTTSTCRLFLIKMQSCCLGSVHFLYQDAQFSLLHYNGPEIHSSLTKVKVEDTDVMPYYKTVVLSIWINFHAIIIHMGNCKESRNMTFIRFVKYTDIKQNRLSITLFIVLGKEMCQSSNYIYFHIQLNTPKIFTSRYVVQWENLSK